jgi:hypothetical protein
MGTFGLCSPLERPPCGGSGWVLVPATKWTGISLVCSVWRLAQSIKPPGFPQITRAFRKLGHPEPQGFPLGKPPPSTTRDANASALDAADDRRVRGARFEEFGKPHRPARGQSSGHAAKSSLFEQRWRSSSPCLRFR